MFRFCKQSFLLSMILLVLLVSIALFVNDRIVRPYVGDALVIVWLYLFLKSFVRVNVYILAHIVLAFACLIEFAQYFKLLELLGLQNFQLARVILGSTYDPLDLLAYVIGWLCVIFIERFVIKRLSLLTVYEFSK